VIADTRRRQEENHHTPFDLDSIYYDSDHRSHAAKQASSRGKIGGVNSSPSRPRGSPKLNLLSWFEIASYANNQWEKASCYIDEHRRDLGSRWVRDKCALIRNQVTINTPLPCEHTLHGFRADSRLRRVGSSPSASPFSLNLTRSYSLLLALVDPREKAASTLCLLPRSNYARSASRSSRLLRDQGELFATKKALGYIAALIGSQHDLG
jgi:hypothetical protein